MTRALLVAGLLTGSPALLVGVGGCLTLEDIETGRCGNSIIEAGEDCDTHDVHGHTCRPPGSALECRYDCAAGDGACPPGWICGGDAVCREPSGTFVAAGDRIEMKATRVHAGDFDGDGQVDLLATRKGGGFAVHYLDPELGVTEAFEVGIHDERPSIGQLTADALPDVCALPVAPASSTRGITVLRAQEERTLTQTAYSSLVVPVQSLRIVAFDADPTFPGHEAAAFANNFDDPSGQSSVLLFPEGTGATGGVAIAVLFDKPMSQLAPTMATGPIDEGPASPCDELAFGHQSSGFVLVYSACRPAVAGEDLSWFYGSEEPEPAVGGENIPNILLVPESTPPQLIDGFVPPSKVFLPPGVLVGAGVRLFDVDGDGHLDLVIGGDDGKVYLATGLGDGTFASDPSLPAPDGEAALLAGLDDFPLAIAHLDGDATPDWVLPCGISVSTQAFQVGPCPEQASTARWAEVAIGDFNGNGVLDVLGVSADTAGFEVYSGAGAGLFNVFQVETEGQLSGVAAGDFNGDTITDVAFSEAGTAEEGDSLSVSFGSHAGAPAAPISVGRLGEILAVIPGDVGSLSGVDGVTDLLVTSRYGEGEGALLSVAILTGSTSGTISSPFQFVRATAPPPEPDSALDAPVMTWVGRFSADDEHADIAALTKDGKDAKGKTGTDPGASPYRVWALPSTGEGELDPATAKASASLPSGPEYSWMVADLVDLDGAASSPRVDELVVLAPLLGAMSQTSMLVGRMGEGGWELDAAAAVPEVIMNFVPLGLGGPYGDPDELSKDPGARDPFNPLVAADVNGDGLPEVAALGLAGTGPSDFTINVVIFWNRGGGFDVAERTVFAPQVAGEVVTGFAFIAADPDVPRELCVLTDTRAYLHQGTPGASPSDPVLFGGTFTEMKGIAGGFAVTAADLDGDRIEDLVVAGRTHLEMHLGTAVLP